jgi:hypothetical protein
LGLFHGCLGLVHSAGREQLGQLRLGLAQALFGLSDLCLGLAQGQLGLYHGGFVLFLGLHQVVVLQVQPLLGDLSRLVLFLHLGIIDLVPLILIQPVARVLGDSVAVLHYGQVQLGICQAGLSRGDRRSR